MRPLGVVLASTALLLSSCGGTPPDSEAPASSPSSATPTTPTEPPAAEPATPTDQAEPTEAPHPVSLPALMDRQYDGRDFQVGEVRERTASYISRQATYRSGDLTISGVVNIPRGQGPFPVAVLAHGYIDPAVYASGQGMTRERGVLAEAGYIAFHVDYRGHAFSDVDPNAERELRLGYTEDVINAVLALRAWDGPADPERVGLVGRSMGGGVVYNVLTVMPGLVDAAVAFAPVSSTTADNFNRWIRDARPELATEILGLYGEPGRAGGFWSDVSPRTFFDRVTEPVMIHHGTLDDSCPIAWSEATVSALESAGADVTYHVYDGEGHAFGPQFGLSMERTIDFLDRAL